MDQQPLVKGWLERRNEAIRLYIEAGLVPIPLKQKRPYQKGWTKRSPDLSYDEVIAGFTDTDNVGLLCGIPFGDRSGSYLRVVDYDDPALHKMHVDNDIFPPWIQTGVVVETGSGKFHHYILCDSPEKYVFHGIKIDHGGEIQGAGTQIVAPPSIHPDSGLEYKFLFEEDWESLSFVFESDLKRAFVPFTKDLELIPTAFKKKGFDADDAKIPILKNSLDSPQENYDYNTIDWIEFFKHKSPVFEPKAGGRIIVQCPNYLHHSSVTCGTSSTMLLPSDTHPGRVRFNCKHDGCANLQDQDALVAFLGGPAALSGYIQTFRKPDEGLVDRFTYEKVAKNNISSVDDFKFHTHTVTKTGLLPAPNPLIPPGKLGSLVRWVIDTSPNPVPILSLAACISYASALLGHAYTGLGGAKPQFYTVGIAPTGLGKEHIRSALKSLSALAGNQVSIRIVDGKMTSLRALEKKLNERDGRMVWMLDEFGKAMIPILDGSNNYSYMSSLADLLLQLDGMTNTVYCGQNYADSGKNETVNIRWPILSLYGTTAPDSYIDQLDSRLVHDGFLNRILHFRSRDLPPIHKDLDFEVKINNPPQPLIDLVADWELRSVEGENGEKPGFVAAGEPSARITPRTVRASDDAKRLFYEFETEIYEWKQELNRRIDGGQDILARTTWKVRKMALLLAAADHYMEDGQLTVNSGMMAYAIDLVRYSESEMVSMIPDLEKTARSKFRQKELNSIIKFVDGNGEEGVTMSMLTRRFRNQLDRKKRDELVVTLLESHELVKILEETGGRSVTKLVTPRNFKEPPPVPVVN